MALKPWKLGKGHRFEDKKTPEKQTNLLLDLLASLKGPSHVTSLSMLFAASQESSSAVAAPLLAMLPVLCPDPGVSFKAVLLRPR